MNFDVGYFGVLSADDDSVVVVVVVDSPSSFGECSMGWPRGRMENQGLSLVGALLLLWL